MTDSTDRWTIHGPTGNPVRPGDPHLWIVLDTSPHELAPIDAVRMGEALQMAGARALTASPQKGHGHIDTPHDPIINDVVMEE